MRKTFLALAGAAACTTLAITGLNAQGAPDAAEMDTTAITSGTYSADPAHTLVVWGLDHLGFNDYFGIFGDITGTLQLDTDDISNSSVEMTIPISQVTVASEGLRDHLLRAGQDGAEPDFFGPDPEPARFVSTAVHRTGDQSAHIMGDLTFNGETNPITIEAELAGMGTNGMNQKETVGFHGTTTITRSEWGLDWGTQFGLGDEVELEITAAFEKD
ncbi:YceI family protein [Aurantiacibacter poecillastricola]|uniref:YceI family protein n=1 Tax=Aurantiacibacter poecillastricola TaxID=3064385 RepID=UPI00273D462F|nr:YceI family protein [Aurantiacibacter sp. 219JJ12-13]MDP5261911.1 YceI family protein [Aurantiacibacter sp. 219JJ12-13]